LKKYAFILFSVLYLIPATGVSLDMHKCGKKIKVIAINAPHGAKCPCGTDMPFNCCTDFHVKVKIDDNQKLSKSAIGFRLGEIRHFVFTHEVKIGVPTSRARVFDFATIHAPPFKDRIPVFLWNNVFRI